MIAPDSSSPRHLSSVIRAVATIVLIGFSLLVGAHGRADDGPASADPTVQAELARARKYPWFDSATGQARSIELRSTPQPDGPVIWEWWDQWFRWNRNNSNTTPWSFSWGSGFAKLFEWTAWILLIALAVYFIWLMRISIARGLGFGPARVSGSDDDGLDQVRIENLPVKLAASKTDLLTQVQQHLAAGRFEDAMIYLFSYQLITLDKAQRLRLEKGKTNRQYLRELGGSGELLAIVGESTRAFEDVFFGRHNMPRDRFERIWARLSRFQELARPAQPTLIDGEAA